MNFTDWYIDRMDVYRVTDALVGNITKHTRVLITSGVPCRIYQSSKPPITMKDTAARTQGSNKLMCGLNVDVRKGDELLITRTNGEPVRYFAGDMQDYREPFGAVLPGLAHKEMDILSEVRA